MEKRVPWNKGLKGWTVGTKAGFQKGHSFYEGGERGWFKRTDLPQIKCKTCGKEYQRRTGREGRIYCSTKCCRDDVEWRNKVSKSQLGRKLSKEVIRKCLRRRRMSGLEEKVQKIISENNLPYKFTGNGKFFIERKNPDFININGQKKAVEVYWKRHKDQFRGGTERWMKERQEIFNKYGWKIIFIEGSEVNKQNILSLLGEGG